MVEGDVDHRGVDGYLEKGGKHHGEGYDPLAGVFHGEPLHGSDVSHLVMMVGTTERPTRKACSGSVPLIEHDLHRHPLDHLDEIARRVFGGKRENADPVPAMTLSTFPVNVLPG